MQAVIQACTATIMPFSMVRNLIVSHFFLQNLGQNPHFIENKIHDQKYAFITLYPNRLYSKDLKEDGND
jgi:hypothetical protein